MHADVEGAALKRFLPTTKEVSEKGDEESASVCEGGIDDFEEEGGDTGADSERHVAGTEKR